MTDGVTVVDSDAETDRETDGDTVTEAVSDNDGDSDGEAVAAHTRQEGSDERQSCSSRMPTIGHAAASSIACHSLDTVTEGEGVVDMVSDGDLDVVAVMADVTEGVAVTDAARVEGRGGEGQQTAGECRQRHVWRAHTGGGRNPPCARTRTHLTRRG